MKIFGTPQPITQLGDVNQIKANLSPEGKEALEKAEDKEKKKEDGGVEKNEPVEKQFCN